MYTVNKMIYVEFIRSYVKNSMQLMCLYPWPLSSNSSYSIVFCPVKKKNRAVLVSIAKIHTYFTPTSTSRQ